MRNDFMAALNQVCHERQLPLDVVLEAVETALVSAYKRSYGSNTITAKIDPNDGSVKIFVQKEVVDDVLDDKNEISLPEANLIDPEAELGSVVQIESTPDNFGRIAAQTTKQVILQRIREAERDVLYRSYAEREGEIVNGTVHKVDSQQVILALGKVEAILPRAEQIPTERYGENQRLRAYVSEVAKTPRGPLIIVSRTHRNMLRRLLEVEVPEIYNGTVEIKAIAREAGYRSKVAVAALQEGVDPVGSCVGMRGVRIQSIVNELNGEKIDVAEWHPDTRLFIANALSPAKVLNVILQDITGDKTALVVVPDRQLSLAIGKEGQNARLAAKLTGWRIDIKSAVEAAQDALDRASGSEDIKHLVSNRPEIFSMVSAILSERKEGTDLTQGELQLLSEAIELVEQARIEVERVHVEEEKAARVKALAEDTSVDLLAEAEAILSEVDLDATADEVVTENVDADEGVAPITEIEAEGETAPTAEAEVLNDTDPDPEVVTEPDAAAEIDEPEAVTEVESVDLALDADAVEAEDDAVSVPTEEEAEPEPVEPLPLEIDYETAVFEEGELPTLESVLDEPVEPKKPKRKRLTTIIVDEEEEDDFDFVELRDPKRRAKTQGPRRTESGGASRRRRRSRRDEWGELYDE